MGEAPSALLAPGVDPCLSGCCVFSKGLPGRAGTRRVVQLNFRPLMPLERGEKIVSGLGWNAIRDVYVGMSLKRCYAHEPTLKVRVRVISKTAITSYVLGKFCFL